MTLSIIKSITKTDTLKGIQIGFVNIIEQGFGLQLGIGNIATKMTGLQVGLINKITNGFLPVFPIINFSMSNNDDPAEEEAQEVEEAEEAEEE